LCVWRALWMARLEGIEPPTHGLEVRARHLVCLSVMKLDGIST
jgi:hypothetical protein